MSTQKISELIENMTLEQLQMKAIEIQQQTAELDMQLQQTINKHVEQFSKGFKPLDDLEKNITAIQENIQQLSNLPKLQQSLKSIQQKLAPIWHQASEIIVQKQQMINYQNFKTLPSKILYLQHDELIDYLETIESVFIETKSSTDPQVNEIRSSVDLAIFNKLREVAEDFLQQGDQNYLEALMKIGISQQDMLSLCVQYILKNCHDYSSVMLKLKFFTKFLGHTRIIYNQEVFKLLESFAPVFERFSNFDEEFLDFKSTIKQRSQNNYEELKFTRDNNHFVVNIAEKFTSIYHVSQEFVDDTHVDTFLAKILTKQCFSLVKVSLKSKVEENIKAMRNAQPFTTRVVALFHDLCISEGDVGLLKNQSGQVQQTMQHIIQNYPDVQPSSREIDHFVQQATYEQYFTQLEKDIPIPIVRVFYTSILTFFSVTNMRVYELINNKLTELLPTEGATPEEQIKSVAINILKIQEAFTARPCNYDQVIQQQQRMNNKHKLAQYLDLPRKECQILKRCFDANVRVEFKREEGQFKDFDQMIYQEQRNLRTLAYYSVGQYITTQLREIKFNSSDLSTGDRSKIVGQLLKLSMVFGQLVNVDCFDQAVYAVNEFVTSRGGFNNLDIAALE